MLSTFKRTAFVLLSIALVFSLAACGGGNSSQVPSEGTTKQEGGGDSGKESQKEVKLTFQNAYPDETNIQHRVMRKLIDDYTAANPAIKIEIDSLNMDQQKIKLKTQAASDSMPDITVVNASAQMEPFVTGGKLAPLDDILAREGLGDSFQTGILDYYKFDDHIYALPDGNNVAAVYYNKELFEQAGVAVPKTFEELVQAAKTFNERGIIPMVVGEKETWTGSYFFMNIVLRLAGPGFLNEILAGKKDFMDPAFVESIAKMKEFIQVNGFQEGATSYDYDMAENLFITGKTAMYFMGTWATAAIEDSDIVDKIGVFAFPTVNGKGDPNEFMLGPGTGFALAANSPHLAEAKDFLHYYMLNYPKVSFEMKNAVGLAQKVEGDFQAAGYSKLAMDVLDMFKSVNGGDIAFDNTMDPSTTQVHLNSIQNLFASKISPEEAAKEHQNAFEENKQ
ncbi:extracellular solute-binding protein [Paenibacillus eucommiae]|uniref:Raffinose/stachyose/melibiose transport system substrate-binding protein n=1 Tax=Paenibacillus eucommiae TaxID=1355755 RepID=A0ABS4INQ8_9BACL|nr:extracellular solute-binding protein [Paenibacillus eucommiae]MBP1988810.1 raffinose/stachyose/melibiose transport system substrate-binding protein [Paenibacillus eucommiae]